MSRKIHNIKTVLLGGSATGKTSFMRAFFDKPFDKEHKPTTSIDFLTHPFITAPETEAWQIWDGSTTDPMAVLMLNPSMAFLFVDLDNIEKSIRALEEKKEAITEDTHCAIIFSKSDLVNSSVCSRDEIKKHTAQVKQAMALSLEQLDIEADFYITTTTDKTTITEAFESNEDFFVSTTSDEESDEEEYDEEEYETEPTTEEISAPAFNPNFDYASGKMRTLFPTPASKDDEPALPAPTIEYQF